MAMESIESFSSPPPMKMEKMPPLMQESKIDDDVNNNKKKLPDEHHRRFTLFLLIRILPMFLTTVVSFLISYLTNQDYSLSVGPLGAMLIALLAEYFLPVYIHMPENQRSTTKLLWIKSMIWFLSMGLVFIAIFLCSKIWEWSFISVALVVLVLSLILLYSWIIGDLTYQKIWLSGKEDETEDPTGK